MTTAFGPQSPNYTTSRPARATEVSAGVDTWAKDCSSAGANDGTILNADFFNVIIANLREVVNGAGLTLDNTNDELLYDAILAIINSALANVVTKLSADVTLYVNAATGSDTNTGTSDHPFATLQGARNYAMKNFNLAGQYSVTYSCSGTFTAGVLCSGALIGQAGEEGEVFSFTSASSVTATNSDCFRTSNGAKITVQASGTSVTLSTAGSLVGYGHGLAAIYGSQIHTGTGINFGTCYSGHACSNGGIVVLSKAYTISGGAQTHLVLIESGGFISLSQDIAMTVTLVGTPNFSVAFAYASAPGQIVVGSGAVSFSGSATGTRYFANNGGIISTSGGGSTFLPGNAAGSVTSPGAYN